MIMKMYNLCNICTVTSIRQESRRDTDRTKAKRQSEVSYALLPA